MWQLKHSNATVKIGLRPVMGISLEGATNVGVLSYLLISVVSEAGILRKCMKALFQLQSLWSG